MREGFMLLHYETKQRLLLKDRFKQSLLLAHKKHNLNVTSTTKINVIWIELNYFLKF